MGKTVKFEKEIIKIVLENKEVADDCLRELTCDVLTKIKELNARKIDTDLEGLKNGTPFKDLFNQKDITIELYEQSKILTIFIKIAKNGIEKIFEELNEMDNDKKIDPAFTMFANSVVEMYGTYVREKVKFLNGESTQTGGVN